MDFRSKYKKTHLICTSWPQITHDIMPLWNMQTTKLDPIA